MAASTARPPAADAIVQVAGLRVDLAGSGRAIVADVNVRISAGEVLGLVGESGSGKTTVGNALLGFVRKGAAIAGGTVLVDGTDVLGLSPAGLQTFRGARISYVPQDPATALNPALRIGTQLTEVLAVHLPRLGPPEREQRVAAALAEVRLPADSFTRRFPHQLSGGQQQRVCLAMAFLLRPRAIVLDEPTTGLDVSTQAHILAVVRQLCRAYRVAALYITHDLTVVAGLAQRVAVMSQGRVVEQGGCQQVLRAPKHPYTVRLVSAVPDIADHPDRDGDNPSDARADHARPGEPPAGDAADEDAALRQALQRTGPGQDIAAVSDVRCGYGGLEVIRGVTLALRCGECLALVGESGSGKTTLTRALVGLHPPRSGEVALAGRLLAAVARDRPPTARRALQYIFQNPYASLNPRKSVGQILAGPHRHFFGGTAAEAMRSTHAALDRVALPASMAARYPDELSGGERQRVAIARALVCHPHVLVCDEVTSALDIPVQAQILDLLAELRREQHLSLLFVTHNMAVVRHIADRVAVLQHGRIVEEGQTDQVLDHPQHGYTRALIDDTPSWTAGGTRPCPLLSDADRARRGARGAARAARCRVGAGQYVVRVTADQRGAAAPAPAEPGPGAPQAGQRQVAAAVGSAGVIGGAAGAALAAHRGARAATVGALAGAAGLAASEAVARARQRPGELPPLWQRIAASATLVAPLGWAAGRLAPRARPVAVGAATQFGVPFDDNYRRLTLSTPWAVRVPKALAGGTAPGRPRPAPRQACPAAEEALRRTTRRIAGCWSSARAPVT